MEENFKLVTALFANRLAAEEAYMALPEHGIKVEDVSIIGPKGELTPPAVEGGTGEHQTAHSEHPRAEGAAIGAALGAAVGFIGGMGMLLSGLLVLEAIGLSIAGPLVGALAGAGLSHSSKSVVAALKAIGVPEAEARSIETEVRRGGIVLAVAVREAREKETRGILEQLGGRLLVEGDVRGLH